MTSLDFGVWAALVAILLMIAWVDYRSRRIPNGLTVALFITGLGVAMLPTGVGLSDAVLGTIIGFSVLMTVALLYRRYRGTDGIGFGDVKFLSAAGAWTGSQGVGAMILLAALISLTWVHLKRLTGTTLDSRTSMPFGPSLCLALFVVRAAQQVGLLSPSS